MRNYLDLTGKVALITGASSGIGAATAAVFADLGAKVAIGYFHNQKGAEEARAGIASAGGKAIAIRADVCQENEIRRLVKSAADELGPIDILVNNAGSLVERMKIHEVTGEKWDGILNLNLKSAVLCSQAVAASMMERRDRRHRQRGFDRRAQRRRARRGSLLGGQSRADRVHQIAGQGTGAARHTRERGLPGGDRHAVSRSVFDARDDAEFRGHAFRWAAWECRWSAPRRSRFWPPMPPASWWGKPLR